MQAARNTEGFPVIKAVQEFSNDCQITAGAHEDLVCRFDPEGTITYANDAYCRYLGCGREEVIGSHILNGIAEDYYPGIPQLVNDLAENPRVIERGRQLPDGRVAYHQWKITAIRDHAGHVVEYHAVGRDITDLKLAALDLEKAQKELEAMVASRTEELIRIYARFSTEIMERIKAEEALKDSQQRLMHIANHMLDMVGQINQRGEYEYVTPSYELNLGYSPLELIGSSVYRYVHPDDVTRVTAAINQALTEHSPNKVEYRHRHADGYYVWVETFGNPMFNSKGENVGAILSSRNISDRKLMELDMQGNISLLKAIMNAIPNPVFYEYMDHAGLHQGCNRAFEECVGMSGNEIVEKSTFGAADVTRKGAIYEELDLELFRQPGVQSYEAPVRFADGLNHNVIFTKASLDSLAGIYSGFVGVITDITERKRMEEALRASEQEYRLVVDNANEMIVVVQDDRLQFYNPCVLITLGYSAAELDSRNYLEFIYPQDRPVVREWYRRIVTDRQAVSNLPVRILTKSGEVRWVDIKSVPVMWEGRGATLNFMSDVTGRKKAEIALRKSEERYRLILENANDLIVLVDLGTMLPVYYNPAVVRTMLYSEEELQRSHVLRYVHPDDRNEFIKWVNGPCPADPAEKAEFRFLRKDGSFVWLEMHGTRIVQKNGRVIGLMVGRDMTDRKLMEEALRRSEQELRSKVDYLNMLLESMNEGFFTYDLEGRITFANNNALELLGFESEDILGRRITELFTEDTWSEIEEHVVRRLQFGHSEHYESMLAHSSGRRILVRLKGSPIIENGTITGGMVLCEDLTERKQMEKEMIRLDRLRVAGEMAAGIAHEIRNPMTTVRGFLQMLHTNNSHRQLHECFEVMIEELDRANSIITEFLSVARERAWDLAPHNLNEIIATMCPLMAADAASHDKSVEADLGDIPALLLDAKEIRQLILNLVRNGLDASQPGQTVTIRTRLEEDAVVLSVEDQGTGISPEVMDKLGTPFFSTKDQGTGLGLVQCYSIASHHNATVNVATGDKGTTFSVRFPVAGDVGAYR